MSLDLSKYQDVINRLVSEAVSCSPATWKKGTLSIDCDGRAINYKLRNEEDPNKAELSPALRKLCEELYVVMRKDGNVWTECAVHFFQKEEDSWGMKINFEYPNAPTTPPAP